MSDKSLQFSASPRIRFVLYRLRELENGRLGGEVGTEIDPGLEAAVTARVAAGSLAVRATLPETPPALQGLVGPQAAADLERQCAAEIRAASGDIGETLGREKIIELRLPFQRRNQPAPPAESQVTLALAIALLFPEAAGHFSIYHRDRRILERRQAWAFGTLLDAYRFPPSAKAWLEAVLAEGPVATELTLSVPGSAAAAWLRAPAERDPDFFQVYSRVAVAVERALRKWLPLAYFSDPRRYAEVRAACPVLFYQTTWPTPGQPRSEFGYDLVSEDQPGPARSWAVRPLAAALARFRRELEAAGRQDLAESYAPWLAGRILTRIVRQPRLINTLFTADVFFIDRMVRLGLRGRELARMLPLDPRRATRELLHSAGEFSTAIRRKLWRLYCGRGFTVLAPLLFVEATQALVNHRAPPAAILRLRAGGREQTFVNASYAGCR